MTDTITFKETMGEDIFARALWAALCEDRSIFPKLGLSATSPRDQVLTIECKIDGIEVSLKGYLERLKENIGRQINNAARELLRDYLRDRGAGDRINTMTNILDKFEKQLVAEFFPNDPDFNPHDR